MNTMITRLTTNETPFGITYLHREIFFEFPEADPKEAEDMYKQAVKDFNWLHIIAYELPEPPKEIPLKECEEGLCLELNPSNITDVEMQTYLLLRAFQPARTTLIGGDRTITLDNHPVRNAVFVFRFPETELHKTIVEEFMETHIKRVVELLERE